MQISDNKNTNLTYSIFCSIMTEAQAQRWSPHNCSLKGIQHVLRAYCQCQWQDGLPEGESGEAVGRFESYNV